MDCATLSRSKDHPTRQRTAEATNPCNNYYRTSQRPTEVYHKQPRLLKAIRNRLQPWNMADVVAKVDANVEELKAMMMAGYAGRERMQLWLWKGGSATAWELNPAQMQSSSILLSSTTLTKALSSTASGPMAMCPSSGREGSFFLVRSRSLKTFFHRGALPRLRCHPSLQCMPHLDGLTGS
ncbi:hypothetical protein V8C34DRAFT_237540 [Trichoderma compactum]